MSVPATPTPPARPGLPPAPHAAPRPSVSRTAQVERPPASRAVPPVAGPPPSGHAAQLREGLRHVLSGLRFPARRWEVIAEADSWGVGGPLRQAIGRLPDGSYPSLGVVLEVLTGPAGRTAPDPGAAVPGRVVVPMRAPENGPRRTP